MAKKTLKKKVAAKSSASRMSGSVLDSARDIWLAGLGAFSVAQNEGSKLIEQGNKLFETLVEEGSRLEKSTRQKADRAVGDWRGEVESRVDSVRKQAADNWDKLEGIFEDRVARVLGRLGVPTAEDVNALSARVQTLAAQVAALAAAEAGAKQTTRKTAGKKKVTRKAAGKKKVTRKTAGRKKATRKKATARKAASA